LRDARGGSDDFSTARSSGPTSHGIAAAKSNAAAII